MNTQFKLAEMRRRTGMTQAMAAARIGVSLGSYRSWELGYRMLNFEQAVALADLFACTLDDLAGRVPPQAPEDRRLARVVGAYEAAGESGRALMAALVDVAARAR